MKYTKSILSASVALFALLFSACSDNGSSAEDVFVASEVCPENMRGTFTDARDDQVYKYTTIGKQAWMAENLRYDDGSACAEETCSSKGRIYGMQNALVACPTGWHLPSSDEWNELFYNIGGVDSAGLRLKATEGWTPLNPGWASNGTDDCGFALLPIPASSTATNGLGGRKHDGYVAMLWTSNRAPTNDYTMDGVFFETQTLAARMMTYYDTWDYLSIRCVRD
ncbi:MAG: hypothetical protein IKM81_02940 [Fibrobacter sp.]|jgi:uncharacterized protein (TIGR02145 family)|nr:hypothetical protein [Fibrobacter sp.]